jgi:hypothetical protein
MSETGRRVKGARGSTCWGRVRDGRGPDVVNYWPSTTFPAADALIVVFDGGTLDDATPLRLPPDELDDAGFVEPDRLRAHCPS